MRHQSREAAHPLYASERSRRHVGTTARRPWSGGRASGCHRASTKAVRASGRRHGRGQAGKRPPPQLPARARWRWSWSDLETNDVFGLQRHVAQTQIIRHGLETTRMRSFGTFSRNQLDRQLIPMEKGTKDGLIKDGFTL